MLYERKERREFNALLGVTEISLNDIIFIELVGRNPEIFHSSGKIIKLSSSSLQAIFQKINCENFVQVNNHIIINLKYASIVKNNLIYLNTANRTVEISRRMTSMFKKIYLDFLMKGDSL